MRKNTIRMFHETAMAIMDCIDAAKREEIDIPKEDLYKAALILEEYCAKNVDERFSRTVLFKSAIAIALQADLTSQARELGKNILSDNPNPEIAREINELLK